MNLLYEVYLLLGVYVSVIPLCLGLIKFRKLDRAFIFLVFMIFIETIVSIFSRWQQIHNINNLPSLHFLTFFEFLFGGLFFYSILKTKRLKRLLFILWITFLTYTLLNSLMIQSIFEYIQIPRMLEGYLFVVFSFFYFYELLQRPQLIQLSRSAEFWAVIGFFVYFGTTQFVHLFTNYIIEHYRFFYIFLGNLNRTMVIVYYGIFTIALWRKKLETI